MEVILEFTYRFYNVRVRLDPECPIEEFNERELEVIKLELQRLLIDHESNLNMGQIAQLLFEQERTAAVEVKFSSSNLGIVRYKNWP